MPNSHSSLEPLSSPSPSPPPQPAPSIARKDLSDSELSELTEDEHDSESTKNKRSVASKMTKLDKQASSETVTPPSFRSTTRRKRGGIIPTPMWDWAKPKKSGAQSPEDEDSSDSSEPSGDADEDQQADEDSETTKSNAAGETTRVAPDKAVSESVTSPSVAAVDSSITPATAPPAIEPLSSLTDPAAARSATVYNTSAPPPEVVAPIVAAAAASSIMRSSSTHPSSQASSPSATPPPVDTPLPTAGKTTTSTAINGDAVQLALETAKSQLELPARSEAQLMQSPIPMDEGEMDQDGGEMESDLQPAHRAEALDVLAAIELKFALLRERVYVEKMAALAWEETLVNEGTHPEMTHLQTELSKRKDIRLELASRKRSYELANAKRRRRADEDAVWSWWKLARDELQTEMIAATNRKRRKLERERRAIDRLQPIRTIPEPIPISAPLPAPPSFKAIVKESAQAEGLLNPSGESPASTYPDLPSLGHEDVDHDFQLIFQTRRPPERYLYDIMTDEGVHAGYHMGLPARSQPIAAIPGSSVSNEGEYPGSNDGMYRRSPSPAHAPVSQHERWHDPDHLPTHTGEDGGWGGPKRTSKDDVARDRARESESLDQYRDMSHHNHPHSRRPGHHHVAPHERHHHHHHHHHIVHHHHPTQSGIPSHANTPSSMTPQPGSLGQSPRSMPEFDSNRPRSGPILPEPINLSSNLATPWKRDEGMSNGSDGKVGPLPPMDDRDRPMATPFVMASTHAMQSSMVSTNPGPSNGSRSPRTGWSSREEDNGFRVTPSTSNYLGSHESYPPSSSHRYTNSNPSNRPPPSVIGSRAGPGGMGTSPPRHRIPPSPPSNYSGPLRSPSRYGAIPLPPPSQSQNRSPIMSKGHHSTSPLTRTGPSSSMYSQNLTNSQHNIPPLESKGGRTDSPFRPLFTPSSPSNQPQPAPPQSRSQGGSGAQDPPSNVSPSAAPRSLASILAPVDDH